MAEWYYIGHYGQLGPLSREQVDELIQGGVIVRETYVWCTGWSNWQQADQAPELAAAFRQSPLGSPPPPPMTASGPPPPTSSGVTTLDPMYSPYQGSLGPQGAYPASIPGYYPVVKSDRNRIVAGLLNIIIPGVGRMYLGYAAIGVLQLFVAIATCGIGYLWGIIDGIVLMSGGVKHDGYGRALE